MSVVPSSSALRALALEYKSLQEEPVEGFRVKLVGEENLFEWEVAIFGPPDTLYQGGYFKNGKPVEIRLIDFQFSRYCSPVMDVVQYIFTTTEKPLRDLHYQDLINLYYNSLAQFLNSLGSDVEQLFPYSVFQNHLKQFGKFGLCIAILGPDSEALRKPKDELYKEGENKRLIELIDDLGRLGYI